MKNCKDTSLEREIHVNIKSECKRGYKNSHFNVNKTVHSEVSSPIETPNFSQTSS